MWGDHLGIRIDYADVLALFGSSEHELQNYISEVEGEMFLL